MRLNKAISILEAKITAGVAESNMTIIQQTTGTRATAVGQMVSTEGTVRSDARGLSVNVASEANSCLLVVAVPTYVTHLYIYVATM
jgi:hypothetical protein